jgi:hypothetical protein
MYINKKQVLKSLLSWFIEFASGNFSLGNLRNNDAGSWHLGSLKTAAFLSGGRGERI